MRNNRDLWGSLATLGSLGFTLVISSFAGLALGRWLDKRLGTAPWLMLGGLLAGVVAGFANVFYRSLKQKDRDP